MPKTNLPDENAPRSPAADPVSGATAVVEGPTAEQAIARVHAEHGPDARIVDAHRTRRGGIAGFFASEIVQLHVAPAGTSADTGGSAETSAPTGATAVTSAPAGVTAGISAPTGPTAAASGRTAAPHEGATASGSPVDRLVAEADAMPETMDFATFLQQQMHDPGAPAAGSRTVPSPTPDIQEFWRTAAVGTVTPDDAVDVTESAVSQTPTVGEAGTVPTPTVSPPETAPGPAWSRDALLQLGLPVDLVRAVEPELRDTQDDIAWTMAIARAVTPALGPIPSGPALLVGPHAERLSGEVAAPTARSRMWFEALHEGRWIHLVVGGDGWRELLSFAPRVLSWTDPRDLPDALRCALELELTLGYGIQDGRARRARPLDVALAIRALVDGR